MSRTLFRLAPLSAAMFLGACAGDSMNLFQTASVTPPVEQAAAVTPPRVSRVDPACVALSNQIDGLRKEGSVERLEKVAAGKGDTVQVKRASVAKQAELNKANADFQAKCGPRIPQQAAAPTVPAAADAAQTAVKAAAAQPAVKIAAVKTAAVKAAAPVAAAAFVASPQPARAA